MFVKQKQSHAENEQITKSKSPETFETRLSGKKWRKWKWNQIYLKIRFWFFQIFGHWYKETTGFGWRNNGGTHFSMQRPKNYFVCRYICICLHFLNNYRGNSAQVDTIGSKIESLRNLNDLSWHLFIYKKF